MRDLYFAGSIWCNVDIALRSVETVYRKEIDPLGLSIIEWYILRALYEHDGMMAGQLARAVGRQITSFTPILDKIERKGLVKRQQHPTDRRSVKIHLTPYGKVLEAQVIASAERIEDRLRKRIPDEEWHGYKNVVENFQVLTPSEIATVV